MTTPGRRDDLAGCTAADLADGKPGISGQTGPGAAWGCPPWCDGQDEADDGEAAYHSRIVAWHDGAVVALSAITYRDPAQAGSTVVMLNTGQATGPAGLGESDVIRLLGTIETAGDGPSWLSGALRSALHLLDPEAGWTGRRQDSRRQDSRRQDSR